MTGNPVSGGRTHIIGIGGIGMSAIAEVMAARGHDVQGSDQKDGPNLRRLAAKGIPVFVGHAAGNLRGVAQVVVSTAVRETNAELQSALSLGLPVLTRAKALAAIMDGYRTVSVTGSHGKTTTTAMIAWMLEQSGYDPTAIVGGVLRSWASNARVGNSPWMVVEADESDGTFIELPTEIGVVTNIDTEHLDYYGSESALNKAFETFFQKISSDGSVIAGVDNAVVARMTSLAGAGGQCLGFGMSPAANVRALNIYSNGGSVTFDVEVEGEGDRASLRKLGLKLKVPGAYNALNAAAAIAVGMHIGLPETAIFDALASFEGVDRRFTQTGDWNGVAIFDDYAHHPAEIEAALSAARGASKGAVIAVVQPHRYSRLASLFDGFCGCFSQADTVLVTPVYAAGENPNGYDRDRLVEGIRENGHAHVYPIDSEDMLAHAVASLAKPGDLVIGLGAGTISEWARALPGRLALGTALAGAAE